MTPNQAIVAKIKAAQLVKDGAKPQPAPRTKTLAQWFASLISVKDNCNRMRQAAANDTTAAHYRDMAMQHEASINAIEQYLPRGSGIDAGTTFDSARSGASVLRFNTSFHHMDQHGGYDGWTEHLVTVRPAFEGLDIVVTGRDRNQIKDYLHDTFRQALTQNVMATFDNGDMSFDVVHDI